MKIRHPALIKLIAFVASWLIRVWIGSLRFRHRWFHEDWTPARGGGLSNHYLYTFWHENLLIPAYFYGGPKMTVLISEHADGRLIAETCRYLNVRVVTGSTTRGGVEAVRKMVRVLQRSHVAITPDGPRGPRRRLQPGVISLASMTGIPIVPNGFAYSSAWRLRTWDRLA